MDRNPTSAENESFLPGSSARILRGQAPAPRRASYSYDTVLDRVEQSFSLFLSGGKPVEEPPGVLLAELAPLPQGEAGAETPSSIRRRAIPLLSKWLIARSHAVRHEDPEQMLHWALMARLAADSCSSDVVGSRPRLADLRACAWGQLGNALRVCGRLTEADEVPERSETESAKGTGDLTLRAQLSSQIGSLQIARRDFLEAIESTRESARIYEEIGEEEPLANSLVQQATAVHDSGEPEGSLRLLDQALSLLDAEHSPEMALIARLNRARFSIDVDPSEQALSSFFAARELLPSRCSALLLRSTWQEGQILAGLRAPEAAESALLQARAGYLAKGLALEALAVSRDLISLCRSQGNWRRLDQITLDTRAALAKAPLEPEVLLELKNLEQVGDSQLGQFR